MAISDDAGLSEAYVLLGLSPDASLDEIRARYLARAKAAHPDRGGSNDEMAALAAAYELVVTARSEARRELIERPSAAVAVPPFSLALREERREDTARTMREVVRHQTSALRQARRQGTWAAIACAGLAAVLAFTQTLHLDTIQTSNGFEEVPYHWLTSSVRVSLFALFAVLAAILGLLSWRASAHATWIEGALEDLADTLSDKNSYLELMVELSDAGDLKEHWTRSDLVRAIEGWIDPGRHKQSVPRALVLRSLFGLVAANRDVGIPLHDLAVVPGPVDLAALIISKGLERGVIEERRRDGALPGYFYSIAV
jgi:DnaJ domain